MLWAAEVVMKTEEKAAQTRGRRSWVGVSKHPEGSSLPLAYRLTREVSRLGFDWPDVSGVLKKLDEEVKEFKEALHLGNRRKVRDELGDLLFVMVNLARFLNIDPEKALRRTVDKFTSRFGYVEMSLRRQGKSLKQSNIFEMDRLWEEAKGRTARKVHRSKCKASFTHRVTRRR
jgi:tetrapyrrole methylase family protein/MazG family protein